MARTTERNPARLRKRPLDAAAAESFHADGEIDIARSATIAYSSERPTDPVEHLFDGHDRPGATRWVSARPDTTEQVVVEFDAPQTISRLVYAVEETERERTQEVRVELSEDGGRSYRQILVQEYNFSPRGATFEREDQRFERRQATHLRLTIVPNKNGPGTATLTALRLFA
jgi:F5/8 type C domain